MPTSLRAYVSDTVAVGTAIRSDRDGTRAEVFAAVGDLICGFGPDVRAGVLVPGVDPVADVELLDLSTGPRPHRLHAMAKLTSDPLDHPERLTGLSPQRADHPDRALLRKRACASTSAEGSL